MQTVNPTSLGPEMLSQLRGIPAVNNNGNVKAQQSEDVKMNTVHRGAIPPNIQAELAIPPPSSPIRSYQQPKSYIPTRSAPVPTPVQQTPPQQQQPQVPVQLQLWEREILASNEMKRKVS
jgi:hypothetical protein